VDRLAKFATAVTERAFGRPVPAQLGPVLAVGFIATSGSAGLSLLAGVWALQSLGAAPGALGAAFAVSAVGGPVAGILGGRLADRITPRAALVLCLAAQGIVAGLFALVPDAPLVGLAVLVLWQMALAAVATVETVMGASVPVGCDDETRFGMLRVAQNAGWIVGPLAAAALTPLGWLPLFFFAAAVTGLGTWIALRLPRVAHVPEEEGAEASHPALLEMALSRSFVALFMGGLVGECVYVAFEYLLPISLISFHGFSKSEASLFLALNPVLILVFQVRVLGWLRDMSLRWKLCGSMIALTAAAVVMAVWPTFLGVGLVIAIFALAEIVWVPAAQAAAVALAPPQRLGLYLGAINVTVSVAFGVAPWAGLAVQSTLGDAQMWTGFAALGLLAGAIYLAVSTARRQSPLTDASPTAAAALGD
jgi:predicted MFS family arabinose efflux permease